MKGEIINMEKNNHNKKLIIVILSTVIILLLAIIIGMCIYLNINHTTTSNLNNSTSLSQSNANTLVQENQLLNTANITETNSTLSNIEENNANTYYSNEQNILTQQVTLNGETHTITINATTPQQSGDYTYTTTCTIQLDSKTIKVLKNFLCPQLAKDLKLIVSDLKIMNNKYLVIPMKAFLDSGQYEYFYFVNDKGEIIASINTSYGTSVTLNNDQELDGFQHDEYGYTYYKIEGNSFIWIQENLGGLNDNVLATKYRLTINNDFASTILVDDTYDSSEVSLAGKV